MTKVGQRTGIEAGTAIAVLTGLRREADQADQADQGARCARGHLVPVAIVPEVHTDPVPAGRAPAHTDPTPAHTGRTRAPTGPAHDP